MNKRETLNNIVLSIKEIRNEHVFYDESYKLINGWELAVEYYPSDEEHEEKIYFDSTKEGIDVNDWEYAQWDSSEPEYEIYDIIEYLYNCAKDYKANETTV